MDIPIIKKFFEGNISNENSINQVRIRKRNVLIGLYIIAFLSFLFLSYYFLPKSLTDFLIPISIIIITTVINLIIQKYSPQSAFIDEFEMEEIRNNKELNESLENGLSDMQSKKGRLVE